MWSCEDEAVVAQAMAISFERVRVVSMKTADGIMQFDLRHLAVGAPQYGVVHHVS